MFVHIWEAIKFPSLLQKKSFLISSFSFKLFFNVMAKQKLFKKKKINNNNKHVTSFAKEL